MTKQRIVQSDPTLQNKILIIFLIKSDDINRNWQAIFIIKI